MSAAAKEMANPPRAIRDIKIALSAQAAMGVAYVVAASNIGDRAPATAALFFGTWLLHFIACFLAGLAAHQMQRKWWRYMSWQAFIPFGGPLMALMYLQYYRDSRT